MSSFFRVDSLFVVIQDGRTVVYVELDLLTGHPSDPPDVPSLLQAEHTLRTLVEDGQLSVRLNACLNVLVFEFHFHYESILQYSV